MTATPPVVREFSFAFEAKEWSDEKASNGQYIRHPKRLELFEVGPVLVGRHPDTEPFAAKSHRLECQPAMADRQTEPRELLELLRRPRVAASLVNVGDTDPEWWVREALARLDGLPVARWWLDVEDTEHGRLLDAGRARRLRPVGRPALTPPEPHRGPVRRGRGAGSWASRTS